MCQDDDQCYHKPCYGTATCFTDAFGAYSCICPRGWTGKNCSIDIDECSLDLVSPCHHGGTCVNTNGSFECSCVAGYKGKYHSTVRRINQIVAKKFSKRLKLKG